MSGTAPTGDKAPTGGLALADLTASGALRRGHFRLSSGLHSGDYLQCALHLADPSRAESVGRQLADSLDAAGVVAELVVAPALGGLIVGHETARALAVPFIFSERNNGQMTLRRGFSVAPNQPVVVVEDVVTTGRSTREVIAILQRAGARVVGVASIVNRSEQDNPFAPLPFQTLLRVNFPVWSEDECPLCSKKQAIEKPGSRPGSAGSY